MTQKDSLPLRVLQELLEKRFGVQWTAENPPQHPEAISLLLGRSVCRNYRPEPIEEELMGLLFAAALSAPSKSDLQQTSIIRIRDREKMRKIHKILAGSPWIAQAPEFLFFCGDHRRLQEVFSVRQAEFPNNHLDSFFNAAVDCGIVLSHFVQAVHAVGLGCCPISEVRDRCQEFSTLLELPKWVFPLCGLSLGYPVHLEALTPRLGLDCSVHEDRYDCARNSRGILEYDQRRAAIKPYKAPRNPDRFGTPAIYGWSEEKFRQYVEVQRQDFGEYIRSQGFSLD